MSTTTLLTLEQFEGIESADDLELLKGELVRLPSPKRRHMEVCARLYDRLKAVVETLRSCQSGATLGNVYFEMGYLFPGDPPTWLRPDVSITHPNQPGKGYYEGAPLMVFEVASEYDKASQMMGKIAGYLANGAAEVWVIYPDTRNAWVYDPSSTAREAKSIRGALLGETEIPLEEIL